MNAAAQFLIKSGMNHFSPKLWALATNLPLIAGYGCLGLSTIIMVLALKGAELSLLYPIFGLTYVWTTLLSYLLLGEPSNVYKNCGVAIVVLGVAVLGRGGDK
jgi:multidrug transporter EmrE-like cation transporter